MEGFATAYASAIFDYVPDPSDAINFDYDVASSYSNSNKSTSRGTTQTSAVIPTHRNKTSADDDDEIDNNDQHNDVPDDRHNTSADNDACHLLRRLLLLLLSNKECFALVLSTTNREGYAVASPIDFRSIT